MTKSESVHLKKLVTEALEMAEAFLEDEDDERFNLHLDNILDDDTADSVFVEALPLIFARYPELPAASFVAAVLDRAGNVVIEGGDEDSFFGSTLFAVPFHGDRERMKEFVSGDQLKKFEESFQLKGVAKPGSSVVMYPVPQNVEDVVRISPKWARMLSATMGHSSIPGDDGENLVAILAEAKNDPQLLDWMEDDHWLLLGAEVRQLSVEEDCEVAGSLVEEKRPGLIEEWHRYVTREVLPKGVKCQTGQLITAAKSVMSVSLIDVELNKEARLLGLPKGDIYDEILLTPAHDKILVSAVYGNTRLGPVAIDLSLFVGDLELSVSILQGLSRKVTKTEDFEASKSLH